MSHDWKVVLSNAFLKSKIGQKIYYFTIVLIMHLFVLNKTSNIIGDPKIFIEDPKFSSDTKDFIEDVP